jgi:death-on-curing family protein
VPDSQIEWLDELVAGIRHLHELILRTSGGSEGEHTERLIGSCARPFQSAFGDPAFGSDVERAAALFHGIITSHCFVDGNKRTATLVAVMYLAASYSLDTPTTLQMRIMGEVAVATASTGLDVEQVASWMRRVFEIE